MVTHFCAMTDVSTTAGDKEADERHKRYHSFVLSSLATKEATVLRPAIQHIHLQISGLVWWSLNDYISLTLKFWSSQPWSSHCPHYWPSH